MQLDHIDAVVTWVDGSDENHQLKRKQALAKESVRQQNELLTGSDKTRFLDNGEIEYCLKSIRRFAPWVRKIFLVTDEQVPSFLTPETMAEHNIEIVDHKVIFSGYEEVLPTFNTRTIETALWRIPGLAPRFIYFNDDFLLARKTKPKHFFKNGNPVLRGRWSSMKKYGNWRIRFNDFVSFVAKHVFGITRSMHLLLQVRSAKLAGFKDSFYRFPHVPHPVRTKTLEKFFKKKPELFERNIRYKFRNTNQFSAIFLAHHLEIVKGSAVLRDASDAVMINGEMDFSLSIRRKMMNIKNEKIRFVCLQGLESINQFHQKRIKSYFDKRLSAKIKKNKKPALMEP